MDHRIDIYHVGLLFLQLAYSTEERKRACALPSIFVFVTVP
jgi:hypothetical protein